MCIECAERQVKGQDIRERRSWRWPHTRNVYCLYNVSLCSLTGHLCNSKKKKKRKSVLKSQLFFIMFDYPIAWHASEASETRLEVWSSSLRLLHDSRGSKNQPCQFSLLGIRCCARSGFPCLAALHHPWSLLTLIDSLKSTMLVLLRRRQRERQEEGNKGRVQKCWKCKSLRTLFLNWLCENAAELFISSSNFITLIQLEQQTLYHCLRLPSRWIPLST